MTQNERLAEALVCAHDSVRFTALVMQMRTAQRKYFKDRMIPDLVRSRELEATVDKAADLIAEEHPTLTRFRERPL